MLGAAIVATVGLSACSESSTEAETKTNAAQSEAQQASSQSSDNEETSKEGTQPVQCDENEQLADGKCVPVEATFECPEGITVPSDAPKDLICGDAPSDLTVVSVTGSDGLASAIMPSGNMGCDDLNGYFSCWINEHDWQHIPDPKGTNSYNMCAGYSIDEFGKIDVLCRGDAPGWVFVEQGELEGTNTLMEYGNNYIFPTGNMCHSSDVGLTCWSPATKHGFQLSKASYQEW